MTKQEFIREQGVSQMPKLVQVLVGRLWDAAQAEGERVGYRKGVDAVAKQQEEIYKRMYDEGVRDVRSSLSVSFPAALGKVLHRDFRFGANRCNRVLDGVSYELMTMLDPADVVRECAGFGLMLDWDNPLSRDLEGLA